MDGSFGPFNLVLLVIPGLALLLAVRLLFSRRERSSPDALRILLLVAGWGMILVAICGLVISVMSVVVAIGFGPIALVIVLMVADRRRRLEDRALLTALAACAEKGIPLPEAALAFADENPTRAGDRALLLARALNHGMTLDAAVSVAWLKLSTPSTVAIRMGCALGVLGPALKQEMKAGDDMEDVLRPVLSRGMYLFSLAMVGMGILIFLMLNIVPVFDKMFSEFGLKLPVMTVSIIKLSRWIVNFGWLFLVPLVMVATLSFFLAVLYYIGWLPRSLPLVNRLFRRYDGAVVLRGLAIAVRQGMPMIDAVRLLGSIYPLSTVQSWLRKAAERMAAGEDWCDALLRVRLIGPTDAAVLRAAARAGNLPWALEEMAESLARRETYRWQALYSTITPILILLFGLFVGYVFVALFIPLIGLIQGLA